VVECSNQPQECSALATDCPTLIECTPAIGLVSCAAGTAACQATVRPVDQRQAEAAFGTGLQQVCWWWARKWVVHPPRTGRKRVSQEKRCKRI
jgi:hypothetical protein